MQFLLLCCLQSSRRQEFFKNFVLIVFTLYILFYLNCYHLMLCKIFRSILYNNLLILAHITITVQDSCLRELTGLVYILNKNYNII